MAGRRRSLIDQGVDPRVASRNTFTIVKRADGKRCRDRQPWGGFTDPERCDCKGRCQVDEGKD